MTPSRIRSLFIGSALLILALALGFGAILSTGSFKKSLTESYVSSFVLNGGESVRKVEYALKYGKQLDNFFGIQTILQEVKGNNSDVKDVKVILEDGRVAYSLTGDKGDAFSSDLQANLQQMMRPGANKTSWQVFDKQYHALIAIHDTSGDPIGAMDIVFSEEVIAPFARAFESNIMNQTLLVGAIAAVLLLVLLARMQIVDTTTGNLRTTQLLAVVLLVIGLAQTFLTTQAIREFQPVYLSTVQRNHELVGQIVQKNIDKVVAKGVPYTGFSKVEDWMQSIPLAMPEIENIVLTVDSTPLYSSKRLEPADTTKYLSAVRPADVKRIVLPKDDQGIAAEAVVALSQTYIQSKSRAIIVDAVTLLVTTILFSVEIVLFLGIFFHRQTVAGSSMSALDKASLAASDTTIVRPQAFVFFLSASMATSFLPIILKGFDPLFGLPENVFLGLPLTLELVASIVSTMITGILLDRHGWRPPFLAGLVILAAGTLLSAVATNTPVFLLSRLIVGVGYGFAWMAMRGFVASGKTEQSQATGFAALNAGIYAGINCGVILGALLVERLAFSGIFWMSLVLTGVALAFSLAFTTNLEPVATRSLAASKQSLGNFLFDRHVLVFFLIVAIPTAICLMFLNYFVPVYAKTIGISASDVGRLFLLYGLCVVYLGPILSRTVVQKVSYKLSTSVGFALIVGGLLLFGFMPSPLTCTIAVLLLGLSDGIGLVAQNNYFLSLHSVKQFGVGKSMGIFSIVRKFGQTLGPSIFGWLSLFAMGIGWLGATFTVALLVFVLFAQSRSKAATA